MNTIRKKARLLGFHDHAAAHKPVITDSDHFFRLRISSTSVPTAQFWVTECFLCCGSFTGWSHVFSRRTMPAIMLRGPASTIVKDCHCDSGVNRIDWSAQRPDLNPIENSETS
ncbi:hypothetical protein TNCV_2227421 [Trichonephila clavipes]|uniref:Uncharacterized protein n=1 Tax=Trichonephila clavipes TaxID=2585209 RepID=A0A8X6WEB9_TRICX|nr:hypothetical protein TNCV_2227421 [Trichonephila clavipes]